MFDATNAYTEFETTIGPLFDRLERAVWNRAPHVVLEGLRMKIIETEQSLRHLFSEEDWSWRYQAAERIDDIVVEFESFSEDAPPTPAHAGGTNVRRRRMIDLVRRCIDVDVRGRQPYRKGKQHRLNRYGRDVRYGRQHGTWRGYFDPKDTDPILIDVMLEESEEYV